MKNSTNQPPTAPVFYAISQSEVRDLVARLTAGMEAHEANAKAQGIHFGHVGDLNRLRDGLAGLLVAVAA